MANVFFQPIGDSPNYSQSFLVPRSTLHENGRLASAMWAGVSLVLVVLWLSVVVYGNYGGNWTALFCTGEQLEVPPQLSQEAVWQVRGSRGFDGQFYTTLHTIHCFRSASPVLWTCRGCATTASWCLVRRTF